jgi:ABC-2 type transport system permease protein
MKISKNLFSKELKRNSFSLVLWMIIISALIAITMSVYPTFMANQSKISALLSIIPKGALQFKGISDFSDLLSVLGFYASNNVIYMMLLGSIFSIVLSSGILSKEEYNKTAEFLLTRPLTRDEIFFTKVAIILLNVFVLNLVVSVIGLLCLELVATSPFSIRVFLVLSFNTFLLNLLFCAAGLFISVMIKRSKPVNFQCIGLVLILYFISTISKISPDISFIGYFSPFRYVDLNVVSKGYQLNPLHLLYFFGISLVLIFASWLIYRKKDIYI